MGKTKIGKGMKLMREVRADGRPVAAFVAPANRAENHLVEHLMDSAATVCFPKSYSPTKPTTTASP